MTRHLLLLSLLFVCTQLHAAQRNVTQSRHPESRLMAIVVAQDELAYLWILKSDQAKLPDGEELHSAVAYAIEATSIPAAYVAAEAPRVEQEDDLELEWSLDGQAVSLLYRQQPIAFVTAAATPGHSRTVAKAYEQAKPWDEALYQKLFRPKDRDSLLKRGMALHDRRDFAGALQAYGAILDANPKDTVALYESGTSSMVTGDHVSCLAFARRSLASSNDIPLKTRVALHSLIGSCEDLAGNVDASLAAFDAGLALAPLDSQVNFNAGVTLVRASRFNAARGYLKTAMKSAPRYASPYLVYGQLLDSEGNYAAALPLYLRFLMMEPSSPRRAEVAGYIVGVLQRGARLENGKTVVTVNSPATTDAADKLAGTALTVPYALAASVFLQTKSGSPTAESMANALRGYLLMSAESEGEWSTSFVWTAGIQPLQGLGKDELLTTYLYLVAAQAGMPGGKEWFQEHRDELTNLLRHLASRENQLPQK